MSSKGKKEGDKEEDGEKTSDRRPGVTSPETRARSRPASGNYSSNHKRRSRIHDLPMPPMGKDDDEMSPPPDSNDPVRLVSKWLILALRSNS